VFLLAMFGLLAKYMLLLFVLHISFSIGIGVSLLAGEMMKEGLFFNK
jgi:hypothetical protein